MRARIGAAALATALVVAACRELVGIGDAPPGAGNDMPPGTSDAGPVCGIAYAGDACEACLESRCCTAAKACAASESCHALETCLGGCGGDPSCRGGCAIDRRTQDPAEPPFGACMAAQCAGPCSVICGGAAQFYGADAGAACQECIVGAACTAGSSCAADPECVANAWCSLTGQADDRESACRGAHDAGDGAYEALVAAIRTTCATQCAYGNQWYCVGHPALGVAESPQTAMTVVLHDTLVNTRVAGASVEVCGRNLPPCTVLSSGVTDEDGVATVVVRPDEQGGYGPTGYLHLSGAGLVDELYFWSYPVSVPAFTTNLGTITPGELTAAATLAGVTSLDPGRANLGVNITDCELAPAAGVVLQITPSDDETKIVYSPGNGGADASTASGLVAVLDVPVGSGGAVTVTATPIALGRPSSRNTALVAAGRLTAISMDPNQ